MQNKKKSEQSNIFREKLISSTKKVERENINIEKMTNENETKT